MEVFGYIYLIENNINRKLYIGQTTKKRMSVMRKGDNHWLHKNKDAKPPWLGRKHSEETKKKMREARYRQLYKES